MDASFFFGTVLTRDAKFDMEGDMMPTFPMSVNSFLSQAWHSRGNVYGSWSEGFILSLGLRSFGLSQLAYVGGRSQKISMYSSHNFPKLSFVLKCMGECVNWIFLWKLDSVCSVFTFELVKGVSLMSFLIVLDCLKVLSVGIGCAGLFLWFVWELALSSLFLTVKVMAKFHC